LKPHHKAGVIATGILDHFGEVVFPNGQIVSVAVVVPTPDDP